MSDREFRALGIRLHVTTVEPTTDSDTTDTTTSDTTIDGTTMATTATKVNPCHDFVYLSSPEGKKIYRKETECIPNDQKYDGDAKDIIKFVERAEIKGEDLGCNSIPSKIGSDNADIFNTPGKLTVEDCKNHCYPKWTDGSTASNLNFCIKSNMMCLFINKSTHQSVLIHCA